MTRKRRAATLGVAVAMVAGLAVPANALSSVSGVSSLPAIQNAFARFGGLQRAMFLTSDPAVAVGMVLTAAGADAGPALDSACVAATNTPAATHIFEGTASDQTLLCNAAPAINVLPAAAKWYRVSVGAYSAAKAVVNAASLVLTAAQLYDWLARWLEQVLPGSGGWIQALAGLSAWNPPPAPVNPGGGPPTPPPPAPTPITYRDLVLQRMLQVLPEPDADSATNTCIAQEQGLVLIGKLSAGANACQTMPIFFPGQDAGGAAIHDRDAIATHPQWAMLTYMSRADKKASGVPFQWYDRVKYRTFCKPNRDDRGTNCDEYPFYSTVEGGFAQPPTRPIDASLREVPAGENTNEGTALSVMTTDAKCAMVSQQTLYLVVPTAISIGEQADNQTGEHADNQTGEHAHMTTYAGPPSTHLCSPTSGGGVFTS